MEILYRDRPGEESRGLARRSFVDSSEILFRSLPKITLGMSYKHFVQVHRGLAQQFVQGINMTCLPNLVSVPAYMLVGSCQIFVSSVRTFFLVKRVGLERCFEQCFQALL
jgi:hypothetical protein